MVYAGYKIGVGENHTLEPSVLLRRATENVTPQLDANLKFNYDQKAYAVVGFRQGYAATMGAGLIFNNRLRAGYVYDFPLSTNRTYGTGSHEVNIGYTLGRFIGE